MSNGSQRQPRREFRGTGIYWSVVAAVLLTVAILIAIIANLQLVEFHYLGAGLRAPLIVVLLVTIAATAVLTEVVGVIWRHRRRGQLAAREQMRQLQGRPAQPGAAETDSRAAAAALPQPASSEHERSG